MSKIGSNSPSRLATALKPLNLTGKVPTLLKNESYSERFILQSRNFLRKQVPSRGVPIDVVGLGSFARREASGLSDFDYLIVVHALPKKVTFSRDLIDAIEKLIDKSKLTHPGATRTFGRVISASDLTEVIGLEDDTNRSLTHRILILEESVSLYQPILHRTLIRRILERYFAGYEGNPKPGVPRFLLNDVIRYWRTLAVDYQAKRWEDNSAWGLRYLKLLISRKLAFAGTVASLLLCKNATVQYFEDQLRIPPLVRLALLYKKSPKLKMPIQSIFKIAEQFAIALASEKFRAEAKSVTSSGNKELWPASFRKMQRKAKRLQQDLEEIFFNSRLLGKASKTYLSF